MRSLDIKDIIPYKKGNTYSIKIKDTDIGCFVYSGVFNHPNCHYINNGNIAFLDFDEIQIRYDELEQYEINLISESEYFDCNSLENGKKYLIGKTKSVAKFYTVISKYPEGYYMINSEKQIIKFMYISFVNYRVFKK